MPLLTELGGLWLVCFYKDAAPTALRLCVPIGLPAALWANAGQNRTFSASKAEISAGERPFPHKSSPFPLQKGYPAPNGIHPGRGGMDTAPNGMEPAAHGSHPGGHGMATGAGGIHPGTNGMAPRVKWY